MNKNDDTIYSKIQKTNNKLNIFAAIHINPTGTGMRVGVWTVPVGFSTNAHTSFFAHVDISDSGQSRSGHQVTSSSLS